VQYKCATPQRLASYSAAGFKKVLAQLVLYSSSLKMVPADLIGK